MTIGWRTRQLGDLCEVLDYKRKPITKKDRVAGAYPYYGATGVLDYVEGFIFDEPLVLVGEDGAKWKSGDSTAFAVDGKIWVNNHAHVLKPARKTLLDRWLIYHLNHLDLTEFISGLTVPKLNQGSLREIPVPLPPFSEQQRIVGILDEAFAGIATAKANAERNLQNAHALFESHLRCSFASTDGEWQAKPLGEMAAFRNGLNFSKSSTGEEIKIVGVRDFQNNYWVPWDNLAPIIPDGFVSDSDILKAGDLIFVRSNGNPELIGRCLLVGEVTERTTHSGFTIRARLHDADISPAYLCHYLKSPSVRRQMIDGGNGANIRSLNQGTLSSLRVPFPSITEQGRIVKRLEEMQGQTQRLESIYQRKLAALDALKQSLLHQAFSGQL